MREFLLRKIETKKLSMKIHTVGAIVALTCGAYIVTNPMSFVMGCVGASVCSVIFSGNAYLVYSAYTSIKVNRGLIEVLENAGR